MISGWFTVSLGQNQQMQRGPAGAPSSFNVSCCEQDFQQDIEQMTCWTDIKRMSGCHRRVENI